MIKLYEPKIYQEDIDLVNKTLNDGWISGNSPIVSEFEEKLKNYCGVEYCMLTSSGTTALHLALLGSGLSDKDEVIVPSLSYIATANSVSYIGGKPVFVDVREDNFQIDTEKIEKFITRKTKAILPVHLYGEVPDLKKIEYIAKKYELKVIHDSAESLGTLYEGKHSVSYPDVGIVSFFPNKIITTGEGGALLTNDKEIYEKSFKFRSQGLVKNTDYIHDVIGYNYRISALSAALGFNQIDKIEKHLKLKSDVFKTYKKGLEKYGVRFQTSSKNIRSSYWLTVGIFDRNVNIEKLKIYLEKNQIETRRVFMPLNLQKPYLESSKKRYTISKKLYDSGLCLPTYPYLENENIEYVIEKIVKFIQENS